MDHNEDGLEVVEIEQQPEVEIMVIVLILLMEEGIVNDKIEPEKVTLELAADLDTLSPSQTSMASRMIT